MGRYAPARTSDTHCRYLLSGGRYETVRPFNCLRRSRTCERPLRVWIHISHLDRYFSASRFPGAHFRTYPYSREKARHRSISTSFVNRCLGEQVIMSRLITQEPRHYAVEILDSMSEQLAYGLQTDQS